MKAKKRKTPDARPCARVGHPSVIMVFMVHPTFGVMASNKKRTAEQIVYLNSHQ